MLSAARRRRFCALARDATITSSNRATMIFAIRLIQSFQTFRSRRLAARWSVFVRCDASPTKAAGHRGNAALPPAPEGGAVWLWRRRTDASFAQCGNALRRDQVDQAATWFRKR